MTSSTLIFDVNTGQYYHNNPKYWDRQAFANSVDPDHVASDKNLHCLPHIQQYFRHIKRQMNGLFQILEVHYNLFITRFVITRFWI